MYTLTSLTTDSRLARLFSVAARPCALQLWVLQLQHRDIIECRILYGRLVPYSHATNCWSFSDNNKTTSLADGYVRVKITRLNLYLQSSSCVEFLQRLTKGENLAQITDALGLKHSDKFKPAYGAISLTQDKLVFRPVTLLLNRYAYEATTRSSPHGSAGPFSAAITCLEKDKLFRVGDHYLPDLMSFVTQELNAETGLDFAGVDVGRFGEIELLVFPTLNDHEQDLLTTAWPAAADTMTVSFDPVQLCGFKIFQFQLSISNADQLIHSAISLAQSDSNGIFSCSFVLDFPMREIADTAEVAVFGFADDSFRDGTLCCRWRTGFIREVRLQGHLVGQQHTAVKFDWLEKNSRPAISDRIKAALVPASHERGFTSQVGGRQSDPWVVVDHDLADIFTRLLPAKSKGRFFQRMCQGDGSGRLQFVEWFKELLKTYPMQQIAIFDPYFDSAGLGLLLVSAFSKADYIVFTSMPDERKPQSCHQCGTTIKQKQEPSRIDNLLANCKSQIQPTSTFQLRIYGMKPEKLHDRYILVSGPDGLPLVGFNLSNSIQAAAQNHPLLITPIPDDTLKQVSQYLSGLLQETHSNPDEIPMLFDSSHCERSIKHYEPLSLLEQSNAGYVLSCLTGEPTLEGLTGAELTTEMTACGLLQGCSLTLPDKADFSDCMDKLLTCASCFMENWQIIGEIMAHSSNVERDFDNLANSSLFLDLLEGFLASSFQRKYQGDEQDLAVISVQFFKDTTEDLLSKHCKASDFIHMTKYTALSWAEYYAIKLLWEHKPNALIALAEVQMAEVSDVDTHTEIIRLSLLSQIVSVITISIEFDLEQAQSRCEYLVHSQNGLLQWLGLCAIKAQLHQLGGLETALQQLKLIDEPLRLKTLSRMVNNAARQKDNADAGEVYKKLVSALHSELPATLCAMELENLVDSLRGHMRKLSWSEPWLSKDVIFPLLKNNRAKTDDACSIWMKELAFLLSGDGQSRLFKLAQEAQTTNIAAFLFASSSAEQQQSSLKPLQGILKQSGHIIQQPLASTSNWSRWNDALKVSFWILCFCKWVEYYQQEQRSEATRLDTLTQQANKLAMSRTMSEWRDKALSTAWEMVEFYDQAENLLATRKNKKTLLLTTI